MRQGKIGTKIMQSIVEGTSVEESNKRVAVHLSRKTLVRKLDQLEYSRDEISAVTGYSYLDTMNERKSSELSLAVSDISKKSSGGAKSQQQHKFRYSARRPRG